MTAKSPEIENLLKVTYPFQSFPATTLDNLIGLFTLIEIPENEHLTEIGEDADRFFILLAGQMVLERRNQNEEYSVFTVVEPGEFFGMEAIRPRNHYRVRAIAKKNAKVLALGIDDLMDLTRQQPEFSRFLRTLHSSYQALVEMRLSWKEPDEHVFLSIRKHPFFLWGKVLIFLLIFLAVFIAITISALTIFDNLLPGLVILFITTLLTGGPILYFYIDWKDDFYVITDRKILSRQRDVLLYETKNIIPYSAVQSVSKQVPGFVAALLQYGDVDIRTLTGLMKLKGIPNPEIITAFINNIRDRQANIQQQYTREENIREMRKRLGLETPPPANAAKPEQDPNTINFTEDQDTFHFLNKLFQSLLQLRVVNGDEITYRKHWLILLSRTKYSAIALLLSTSALLYSLLSFIFISFVSPTWFLILVFFISWLVFGAIYTYQFIDWRNDRFVLSNRVIMDLDKKPLGKENRRTAPLGNIQTVEYKREGLIRILFNYGTVFIRVGDTQFTFDEVANPFAVQQEISERLNQAKERERRDEIKRERETILDWIEIYHTVAHKQPEGSKKEPPTDEDVIQF